MCQRSRRDSILATMLIALWASCSPAPSVEVAPRVPGPDAAAVPDDPTLGEGGSGGGRTDEPGDMGPADAPPSEPIPSLPVGDFPPTFSDDDRDPLVEIAVDARQVCGRREGGAVWCWSRVLTDTWGVGTDLERVVREDDGAWEVDLPGPATRLFAGPLGTCAQMNQGRIACWGSLPAADSGFGWPYGLAAAVGRPPTEMAFLDGNEALAVGEQQICGLRQGVVTCAGVYPSLAGFEQVTSEDGSEALARLTDHADYDAVWATDGDAFCARRAGGHVDCWGGWVFPPEGGVGVQQPPAEVGAFRGATVVVGRFADECALVDGSLVCRPSSHPDAGTQTIPTPAAVAAVGGHSAICVLTAQGGVVCFGNNEQGDLGRGLQTLGHLPPAPVALADPVLAIAAAYRTHCALTARHALVCWGQNDAGALGGEPWATTPSGVDAPAPLRQLVVGQRSACGLDADGRARCWGQVRERIGGCERTPTPVGLEGDAADARLVGGANTVCVTRADDSMMCGDLGGIGNQPGMGPVPYRPTGTHAFEGVGLEGADALAVQYDGGCVARGLNLRCFVASYDRDGPVVIASDATLPVAVRSLAFSETMGCLLHTDGQVRCASVGFVSFAQQPDSAATLAAAEVVVPAAADRIGIAVSDLRVCALDPGTTHCFNLATLETEEVATPAGAVGLALGRRHGCFRTEAGAVSCWGDNTVGQLGLGPPLDADSDEPQVVPGLENIVELAAAGDHTCALDEGGQAQCWGDNPGGVIGLESACAVPVPTRLDGP